MRIYQKIRDFLKGKNSKSIPPKTHVVEAKGFLDGAVKVRITSSVGRQSVADKIKIEKKTLNFILYGKFGHNNRRMHYKEIIIPKRNGNDRLLHAVQPPMRLLQDNSLNYFVENFKPSPFAKGFVKGLGIIDNAKAHVNKKILIKLDIKDFFPSITFARVLGMFQAPPFNFTKYESIVFAQICCLDDNGPIPQGAVTSPFISNMICRKLDSRLSKLAQKERLSYSRYADDLAFSTDNINHIDINQIIKNITNIVEDEGFVVNKEKTKVLGKNRRQMITGVVVNDGLNVNRRYIKSIKALLHNCYENPKGIESQLTKVKFKDSRNSCFDLQELNGKYYFYSDLASKKVPLSLKEAKARFMDHVEGRIRFVRQVALANHEKFDKRNHRIRIADELLDKWTKVSAKEKIISKKYIRARNQLGAPLELKQDILHNFTIEQVHEFVKNQAIDDPKYFTFSFSSDEDEYRKEVAEFLKYSSLSLEIHNLLALFRELGSSQTILGGLVHSREDQPIPKEEIVDRIKGFDTIFYKINNRIRTVFDEFLIKVQGYLDTEYKNTEEIDIFSNKKFRQKYINQFKRETRFGRGSKETYTDLKEMIAGIIQKFDYNEINIDRVKNLKHYTSVKSIEIAIEKCLRMIAPHCKGKEIYISTSRDTDNNDLIIEIYNLNINPIESEASRYNIAGGDSKKVISTLNGIATYYFAANFKDIGWKEINMMYGNSIDDIQPLKGVTHKIRIPNIAQ